MEKTYRVVNIYFLVEHKKIRLVEYKSPFFKWIHPCFMVCGKRTLNLEQILVYISYT